MGESATAMGCGRAVCQCPMLEWARRPRLTARPGTVRQLASAWCCQWHSPSGELEASHGAQATIGSALGAVDRGWPLRWANRRRQWAAGVPCARCRHQPVGPGRRDGPAAGLGPEATRPARLRSFRFAGSRRKQEGPSDSPSRTPHHLVEPWTRSSKRSM
jgi:hypothetical protein